VGNRIRTDAEKLVDDMKSVELGVAMLSVAFSNGEVMASIAILRNQLACLQKRVVDTRRQAETVLANVNIHNTLHH